MPKISSFEIDYPTNAAPDLCVLYLIMAARIFADVPETETPHGLLRRIADMSADQFETEAAKMWVEKITQLYAAER